MSKTMKQIADHLGCPKMRVYRYIQSHDIKESFCNGRVKYYDDDIVSAVVSDLQRIIDSEKIQQDNSECNITKRNDPLQNVTERNITKTHDFRKSSVNSNESGCGTLGCNVTECNVTLQKVTERNAFEERENELKRQIEELKQDKKQLSEQLIVKDKQIASLQLQNEQLTAAMQQQAVALENTTVALTAAQALHAGTIHEKLVDKSSQSSDGQFEPELIKKKKGIFAKLFGKD